jgi:hypothetical protein
MSEEKIQKYYMLCAITGGKKEHIFTAENHKNNYKKEINFLSKSSSSAKKIGGKAVVIL